MQLLERYLADDTDATEKKQVDQWYDTYEQREVNLDENKRQQLADDIFDHVRGRIGHKQNTRVFRLSPVWRVAAAVLLVSTLAFGGLVIMRQQYSSADLHASNTGDREQRSILLPDGSEVVLQHDSKISWSGDFKTGPRELELVEGAAFFKIAHNSARPFTLKLPDHLQIRVLGTSFSVNAYSNEQYISVKMKTGRVALRKNNQLLGVLLRGQQLQFDRQAYTATIKAEPVPERPIIFDHTSLTQVAAKLENEYDVHIEVPEDRYSRSVKCSGAFNSRQDVREILQAVCLLHNFSLHTSPDHQIFIISMTKK